MCIRDRIGGVHDDKVVFLLTAADVFEGVLKINVHPAVIHPAGIAGQVGDVYKRQPWASAQTGSQFTLPSSFLKLLR